MDIVFKETVMAPVVPSTNTTAGVEQLIETLNAGATCNQPTVLFSVETTQPKKSTDVDGGQMKTVTKIKIDCTEAIAIFILYLGKITISC